MFDFILKKGTKLNRNELLKNFAIGFLPLFVFILADELYGTEIGLIVALISGLLYLLYYLLRYKRVEKMILMDTLLILILGGVSIGLDNAIFFMLKPALVELILVAILGIHAFSSKPILLQMSKRYLGDAEFAPEQMQALKKLSQILFVVLVLHTAAIVYTAFYASKEVWAFVSGGLFYILFGLILIGQWLYLKFFKRRAESIEEMVPLVNEKGQIVGKAFRSRVHGNPGLLHPVVHLHVFHSEGKLYLQKRSAQKDLLPGFWDTAVGGHVAFGESIADALRRETKEELGIMPDSMDLTLQYIWKSSYESEMVHVFITRWDGPFRLNREELADGRFWTIFEIKKFLGKQVFTPNFEHEFKLLEKAGIISRPVQ